MQGCEKRIKVLVLAIIALAMLVGHAYAQENSGAAPYLDSEHAYQVKIGKVANDQVWVVTNGTVTYTLTTTLPAWAKITPAAVDGSFERVTLFFDHNVFALGTWYLRFYENSIEDGNCVSAREYVIDIKANTFYLALSADLLTCNSQSGVLHSYDQVDTESFSTEVTYTVTMNKSVNFKPTKWSFDATFSQDVQSISVTSSTANAGAISWTPVTTPGSNYSIEVTPIATSPEIIVVNLKVVFSNPIHADVTNTLTVSKGLAVVQNAPAPDAGTQDNITVSDGIPLRQQAITINAIPEARDIEPNTVLGEAIWSASNPLKNSTHNYRVQMGNIGNAKSWRILESDLNVLTNAGNANYVLTDNGIDGIYDLVAIQFKMTEGTYYIEYTETTGTCSTVRRYPITLLGPFDVDIVAATNVCAGVSGTINDLTPTDITNSVPVHETTTTVNYVVNLITTNYHADWSFTFSVTGDPVFDPTSLLVSDLEVTAISSSTPGVTYTTGTVQVTNSLATPVTQAVIQVTYNGIYQNAHNITASLTAITGSYTEADADTDNTTIHTINAMPQAGALAGVE